MVGLIPSSFSVAVLGAMALSASMSWANTQACEPAWQVLRIARVDFEGLRHTRESVVKRRLTQGMGDVFSCESLKRDCDRLRDLDVFASINADVKPESSGVAITYRFRELPPYIPYVSMAKTDQDGFSAGPAVAALNLFGTGTHVELASRFGGTSEIYGSVSGLEIGTWALEYDALVSRIDSWNSLQEFHENSWRFKFDGKRPISGKWLAIGATEFMILNSSKSGVTLNRETDRLPRLGAGMAWDGRDRRKLPGRGVYAEFRAQQTGGWLSGPADFTEWLWDIRGYQPLGKYHVIAANVLHRWRRGLVGSYDLYRAGGANSLRGFAHGAQTGKSESILFVEDRLSVMPQRQLALGKWAIPLAVEAVIGVEILRSWDHGSWAESKGPEAVYLGFHVLTGGLDRIRLEGGSNTSRFSPNFDIGLFDKADAQRFRTR